MTKHNLLDCISRMDSSKLSVHAERCLHVRHKNADCLRCADVCTVHAISRDEDGSMAVAPEKCIGCGTCASVCPTACLTALNPTDAQLEAALLRALAQSRGSVAMACQKALDAAREQLAAPADAPLTADGMPVVGVVCLGRAEEGMLTEAVAKGASAISLIHHDCETCDHITGGNLSCSICDSMTSLLAAIGSSAVVKRVPGNEVSWAAAAEDGSGVAFVAKQDDFAADATEIDMVFAHVQKDGTLPHVVPERRLRLYNSLKRMAAGAELTGTITTRLWGQVDLNTELCRSCRMCTVFCPTGALARFTGKDGGFGVEHRSTLCVQCGLCATLCPEQAITVSNTVSVPEFMTGTKFRFEMQPLGWKPNCADAITSHMVRYFQMPNIQDLEGNLKSYEVRDGHRYARERDARRAEIRRGVEEAAEGSTE